MNQLLAYKIFQKLNPEQVHCINISIQ